MQAIRKIQTVIQGEIHLELPEIFWGQEVEIIVLAVQQAEQPALAKQSLRGALRHYANPDLMAREQGVWLQSVREQDELG